MLSTEIGIAIHQTDKTRLAGVDINNAPFGKIFSDHMFTAEYLDGEWQNAEIVPFGKLQINPAAHSINYGQSLFEGMKAYRNPQGNPQLFRPLVNHKRLCRTALRLCMPTLPEEIFMGALTEIVRLDKEWIPTKLGSALYIRPIYLADDEYIGVKASNKFKFVVITCPVGPYYSEPVNVLVSEKYVRAFDGGVGCFKAAGNYAPTLLPAKEANARGYHNMLWMNGKNPDLIEEIGTMNVFFVMGDQVVTPRLNGNILEGVTRDSVITILKDKGIKIIEKELSIKEVLSCYEKGNLKEAFGAGTAANIAHIAKIGYHGKDMNLPSMEDRSIGIMLNETLDGIKTSRLPDPHGWVYPIG